MAYNSDGYIMIDFTEVDFRRTNQTIDGLYKRCVDVIGTNKFILVINANGRTPLPATCSFTNNQYVIDTCIYMFAISSNDNLFIRRNDVPASDIIDDTTKSVSKTWSSSKISDEIASHAGGAIDDQVIATNKTWSSSNIVNKLAPIDSETGASVTFNTSLFDPIVKCEIAINATQEGSGDPSPSNVRPIHGFSEVNVTANEVLHTIQLGQEVYGAEVDVVNGVAHCTHRIDDMGDINWTYLDSLGTQFFYGRKKTVKTSTSGAVVPNILADIYKTTSTNTLRSNTDYMVSCGYSGYYGGYLLIKNPDYTDADLFKQAMANHKICYELNTPFDIQLTPTQIETIIGNNTIFADTGDTTVYYRYLPIDKI